MDVEYTAECMESRDSLTNTTSYAAIVKDNMPPSLPKQTTETAYPKMPVTNYFGGRSKLQPDRGNTDRAGDENVSRPSSSRGNGRGAGFTYNRRGHGPYNSRGRGSSYNIYRSLSMPSMASACSESSIQTDAQHNDNDPTNHRQQMPGTDDEAGRFQVPSYNVRKNRTNEKRRQQVITGHNKNTSD